jgi:LysM repeat protein
VNYVRDPKIAGTTVDQDQINIQWIDDPVLVDEPVIIPIEKEKSIDQLAIEILAGKGGWGNGIIRKIKLTFAGYDYDAVQKRINEIVAQRKESKKTYIVAKDDTLTSIAKRYNTTVDALVKANGIPNKNKIYVGQELIIE